MSERLEQRLRQVLELLADAPIKYTSIDSDAGGSFIGDDFFIGEELKDQAKALLVKWDEEDEART